MPVFMRKRLFNTFIFCRNVNKAITVVMVAIIDGNGNGHWEWESDGVKIF